jgi:zinc transport system ATP-binding protein
VPPAELRDWRRLGYVPQKTMLDATLPITAAEVVTSGLVSTLRPLQRVGAEGRRQALEALALVGMQALASARVGRLSVGQQQRVLIARALVSDPALLMLDEPTGGVDPEAQASLYRLLHRLHVERGVTVVLVSHDIGVVAKAVTRLACLNRTLVFCGSPAAFLGDDESLSRLYGAPMRIVSHHDPCSHAP